MANGPHERRPGPLAVAAAGAAFALGAVALLEAASAALPGPRATLRTWGPLLTVAAGAVIAVVGLPGAALVEVLTRRASGRMGAGLGGYLAVALAAGAGMWLLWRRLVAPGSPPAALTVEFAVFAAGAAAIWAGARLADRYSPAPLLAFCGGAVALVVAVTALVRMF